MSEKSQMTDESSSDEKAKEAVYAKMQLAAGISLLVFALGLGAFSYVYKSSTKLPPPKYSRSQDVKKWPKQALVQPLRQDLTLVSFWAHWCKPCLDEMPDMITLASKLEGLHILFVNADTEESSELEAKEFAKSLPKSADISFSWSEGKALMSGLGTQVLPAHFLLKPSGDVLWHEVGQVDWRSPLLKEDFERIYKVLETNGSGAN